MSPHKLDCLACPSFCCFFGWVEVSPEDVERLAKFLGVTSEEFERVHLLGWAGQKLIKTGAQACQFLGGEDHKCTVYEARPQRCRSYHCWEQDGDHLLVYKLAAFVQESLAQSQDGTEPPKYPT